MCISQPRAGSEFLWRAYEGYSPEAVAEHTVAVMLALNRSIHRAYARVREGNFALDGLRGFDMNRRTVGIVGSPRENIPPERRAD